jgi:hypothetical protein
VKTTSNDLDQVTVRRGNFTLSVLLSDPIASRMSIPQIETVDTGANPIA